MNFALYISANYDITNPAAGNYFESATIEWFGVMDVRFRTL
jgi:hypothetical protein